MECPLIDVIALSRKLCEIPIDCTLAYATSDNFLGRIVAGYHPHTKHICLMAPNAANALCAVQNALREKNLGLFIFDGYRPLRAVRDFGHWMQQPAQNENELARKAIHYPHIEKNQLAQLGYVSDSVSDHCFGDTVDLTLIDLENKSFLDMGACFDYFDEMSHVTANADVIGVKACENREILSGAMRAVGYLPYEKEYWHFRYREREVIHPLDLEIKPLIITN